VQATWLIPWKPATLNRSRPSILVPKVACERRSEKNDAPFDVFCAYPERSRRTAGCSSEAKLEKAKILDILHMTNVDVLNGLLLTLE